MSVLTEGKDVVEYLSKLSPSGVELEIMALGNFTGNEAPGSKVSRERG